MFFLLDFHTIIFSFDLSRKFFSPIRMRYVLLAQKRGKIAHGLNLTESELLKMEK